MFYLQKLKHFNIQANINIRCFDILVILSFLALQTSTYSSTSEDNKFNQKYLSNYFSALVSSGNQKNEAALDYFNSSKFLNE